MKRVRVESEGGRGAFGSVWVAGALLACFGLGGVARGEEAFARQRPTSFSRPVRIEFSGPINYRRAQFMRSKLAAAKAYGADLVVIEIDSPGGLKGESLDLAEQLRGVDWAHVVAYIPREALSGAALIALGADEIVVAPTARVGDVGVITFDPQLFAFRFATQKVYSVLVRQARDLASAGGYPPDLAEAMIDKDVAVYTRLAAAGSREFLTRRIVGGQDPPTELDGGWRLIEESGAERFLTLSGARAKEFGLATELAVSSDELDRLLNVSEGYRTFRYGMADDIVFVLNLPIVTGLLIIIGLVALYLELSAVGLGMGGLLAALCAVLFFWSRFLGGTAGVLEILLFLAGLSFLLAEVFLIPGWGLPGFVGLVLLVVSVVMAGSDVVIPSTEREINRLLTNLSVMAAAGFVFLICAGQITRQLGTIPIFNRLVLAPPPPDREGAGVDPATGKPLPPVHPLVSVGDFGVAESLLRPAGRVRFGHRTLDVISDGSFIEPGGRVRVAEIQGNRVVVEAVDGEGQA